MLIILLDRLPVLPGVEALAEGARVELQLRGDLTVGRGGQRALVLENPVVVLPELSLLMGAQGGFCSRLGFGVVGKREIAIDEPDFIPVGFFDLL